MLKHVKKSCISENVARKINILSPQVKFIVWENTEKMFKVINEGMASILKEQKLVKPQKDIRSERRKCENKLAVWEVKCRY